MSAAAKPRVDLDLTRERLQRLGLVHAAEQLAERVTAAIKDSVSPHRFVDELLDAELHEREERRVRTSLRLSGLPLGQTLGNFDFSFQPSVDRGRIETLATCAWIREGYTLLLQGPPGIGKTHCETQPTVNPGPAGVEVSGWSRRREHDSKTHWHLLRVGCLG